VNEHHGKPSHRFHEGREEGGGAGHAQRDALEALQRFLEPGLFEGLHAEGFHHAEPGEGFLKDVGDVLPAPHRAFVRLPKPPAKPDERGEGERHQDKRDQGETPVEVEEKEHEADDGRHRW
jgi:hypothetical protein